MRLIDADALKNNFVNNDANGINLELDRYAIKCINNAPTIEPERKRGKWDTVIITIACGHKYAYYACSSCGIASDSEFDFCPNCGADMRNPE